MNAFVSCRLVTLVVLISAVAFHFANGNTPAEAATIFVDISGDDAPMPDGLGRYWNATPTNAPASPAYILTNAVTSTNSPTPVDLNYLSFYTASTGFFTTSIQTGKTGSSITNWSNPVTQDNWYVEAGHTAQVSVEGLLAGFSYDLLFYGARAADANRFTRITINAVNQDYNATDEGLTNFTNIQADANGHILFAMTTAPGGTFAHLSGLQITGTFVVTPAPEPSSVVLLLGMIGLAKLRRRTRVGR